MSAADYQNKKVIQLLLDRKAGKKDNRKLGLLIEGGGMRGVFSGGTMIALEEAGLADVFDVIYGISAGCFSAAYLMSHDTKRGTTVYYDDLNGFKFIQPWKIGKMMNMDYFCDYVVRKLKPINEQMIRASKTIFKIIVSNQKNGRTFYFTNKDEGVDLVEAMKASSSFPGFYYPIIDINGIECLDGNAFLTFPVHIVQKDDVTDLLIISNINEEFRHENRGRFLNFLYNLLTMPLSKAFKQRYHKAECEICQQIDYTFGRKKMPGSFNFFTVAPDYLIAETEIRRNALKKMAKHGRKKMTQILEGNKDT